jgi:23S rRNA (uracil1939-C5)-methyltransferase
MIRTVETRIEGFHPTGPGMGTDGRRQVLVWGALPGEVVTARVRKKRKGMLHALIEEVIEPSPERVEPLETHYLSCSPWQVLNPELEAGHKAAIAGEAILREGLELSSGRLEVSEGPGRMGYRNKMEFSFVPDEKEGLSLALFEMLGRWKTPLKGCALAMEGINHAALHVLEALRRYKAPEPALKTLVLRSDRRGRVLGALFVRDGDAVPGAGALMGGPLAGLEVWYSEPRTLASRPTRLLSREGPEVFEEELSPGGGRGVSLRAGLLGFFQVNPSVFETALSDIAPFLEGEDVVEFFAGVGAISIGASAVGAGPKRALLVESDEEAVRFARDNIEKNGLMDRYEARAALARPMREAIEPVKVAVYDPPRSGLDPKTLRKLKEVRPRRIVYLSCNVQTQARDVAALMPYYKVRFARLYNFFPRTPHIESLMVLELD